MEKRLFFWELGGAVFALIVGSLLHFTYAWSGNSALVGAFSAVNESVWEHMKLLFVPMFVESFIHAAALGRAYPNFFAARAVAVLWGLLLIPTLFYTYTGICGTHVLWADIAVFVLAVLGAFALEFFLLQRGRCTAFWAQLLGMAVLWGLAFAFVWCTFCPPSIALWQSMAET